MPGPGGSGAISVQLVRASAPNTTQRQANRVARPGQPSHVRQPARLRGGARQVAADAAHPAASALRYHDVCGPVRRAGKGAGAGRARLSPVVGLPRVSPAAQQQPTPAHHRRARPRLARRHRRRRPARPAAAHPDGAALRRPRRRPARARRRVARLLQAVARVAVSAPDDARRSARALSLRRGVGSHARPRWARASAPARSGGLAALAGLRARAVAVARVMPEQRANQHRRRLERHCRMRELSGQIHLERRRTIRIL